MADAVNARVVFLGFTDEMLAKTVLEIIKEGRHDRPARRGDTNLVDADDPLDPFVPEAALVAEGRDLRSHRP